MTLSSDEQLSGGQVVTKFLLDDDMDSVTLYLKTLRNMEERVQVMWAVIAVQGGAIRSLANVAGIDPVFVLNRIIAKRSLGIEE